MLFHLKVDVHFDGVESLNHVLFKMRVFELERHGALVVTTFTIPFFLLIFFTFSFLPIGRFFAFLDFLRLLLDHDGTFFAEETFLVGKLFKNELVDALVRILSFFCKLVVKLHFCPANFRIDVVDQNFLGLHLCQFGVLLCLSVFNLLEVDLIF